MLASAPGPNPPSWPPHEPANFGDWVWSAVANAWDWIGTQQAILVALAAVITAIIAIFALRATASDSRERSRPIVLAFFRLATHNESAFDLVVHNFGSSAASDIDVSFDPPFDEDARKNHMVNTLAQRYEKRVPLLPPGSEITNVWWALDFTAPNGSGKNRYPTPDEAVMTITYKGNRIRRYTEKIKLDTNWMKGGTSSVSSASRPGLEKQNADSLKKIAAESRAVRSLLREIADGITEARQPPVEDDTRPDIVEDETLPDIIDVHGGDMAALAAKLGVSMANAIAIAALVERNPSTGDIDIVSSGQIAPGSTSSS